MRTLFLMAYLLPIGFLYSCISEHKNIQDNYCAETYYGNYYPREIKSLKDLPLIIQDSVTNHLKRYLGTQFYDLLNFSEGKIINYSELLEQEPNAKNYQWQVPAYDLGFIINVPQSGIKNLCSLIKLDSVGNVIEEIEFPNISKNALSTTFISKKEIFHVAKRANFSISKCKVGFKDNHIVLTFSKSLHENNVEYLYVSSHNGKIIKREIHKVLG